ncbi:MAG: hypothetical protein AB1607_02495 [Chloroflexota bacterium]
MKDTVTSKFAYAAASFFILGMTIVITMGVQNEFVGSPPPRVIAYVFAGLAFHFALLPVISALPAPFWAKASGYVWVVVDNMILMLTLYSTSAEIIDPLRWGIHLATATWIFGASLSQQGISRWIGFIVAFGMTGASLGGAFDENALELLMQVAGPALIVWLIMAGVRLSKSDLVSQ